MNPRELRHLGLSLERLGSLQQAIARAGRDGLLGDLLDGWDPCDDIAADILEHLVERPPAALGDEDSISSGIDASLDELRSLRDGGKDAIAGIQALERERTSIASLKVGYNRVFGYFIEVSNANKHLIPSDYQRRQTLTGGERYVTPALKEYEEKVLGATERIEQRERELFDELRQRVGRTIARLQAAAARVATLDVLASFAHVAGTESYVRPQVDDGFDLEIVGGRHPVVERMMPRDRFIPNDIMLRKEARMIILTGPNMAGKSTVLRQVGLIVLMAQAGSFVPAVQCDASVSSIDCSREWARVTTLCAVSRPSWWRWRRPARFSTRRATRSLVLLDEIGRGTSTYDGVSIAWAVSEHLHDTCGLQDGVRDALSRTHTAGRRASSGQELQRRRQGIGGRRGFPPSTAAWRRRSIIWNRSWSTRWTPGDSDSTRARRSSAARG